MENIVYRPQNQVFMVNEMKYVGNRIRRLQKKDSFD